MVKYAELSVSRRPDCLLLYNQDEALCSKEMAVWYDCSFELSVTVRDLALLYCHHQQSLRRCSRGLRAHDAAITPARALEIGVLLF